MKKLSKRLNILKNLISEQTYSCDQAIELLKKISNVNFIESIEAHINLNIDPKYPNQQLKTNLLLPHGNGIFRKIAIYTNLLSIKSLYLNDDNIIIGMEDLYENIKNGSIKFDVLITTPDLMPQLAKLGKILGPKGLMPSPKSGTVTSDLFQTILDFKNGKFEYKADKTGIVHMNIGKITFSNQEIKENLLAAYFSIEKNKPAVIKGQYFKSFHICTTMSPSIKLDLINLKKSK